MKKILVFGTFDIFHEGHKSFLKQARTYGDYLIVVIARDKTVLSVKKNQPYNNENVRKRVIEKSGLANEVILGKLRDKYKVVKDTEPDMICLGYDQRFFVEQLEDKLKEFGLKTEIKVLKSYKPEFFKSSKLRKPLNKGEY